MTTPMKLALASVLIAVGTVIGVAFALTGGLGEGSPQEAKPGPTSQATDLNPALARLMVDNLYAAINQGEERWLEEFVDLQLFAKARHLLLKVKVEGGQFTITRFVSRNCEGQQCIFVLNVDYSTASVVKTEKHTVTVIGGRGKRGHEGYLITGF